MELLELIPFGKEHAITRQELAEITGLSDRSIRGEVQKLRAMGYPIVSLSNTKGYWQTKNIEELEQFLRECDNRRQASYHSTMKLRYQVAEAKGEKMVKVREHYRRIPQLKEQLPQNLI